MRILVFGSGVIGSIYAAQLQGAGHDVVVLARGRRLEAIRRDGLRLQDEVTHARTSAKVTAISELADEDPYDLVVVPVRFDQLTSTLGSLGRSRCTPRVLFFGNNPIGADLLIAAIGRERVLLGFPGAGGQYDGDLIRYLVIPQQRTTLGELDGTKTKRLLEIQSALRSSGFSVSLSPDIQSWLKTHAAFVSLVSAAVYAAGGDSAKLAQSAELLRLMVRAVREAFRSLAAVGIREVPFNLRVLHEFIPEAFAVRYWRRQFGGPLGQFSLAAHANSARSEMTALAEEVHKLLASSTVATPAADTLFEQARL